MFLVLYLVLYFPFFFHTENTAVHSEHPTATSVYLPTSRWHHLLLAVHSAGQHHMIYSFTNTTSYSTFYTFFSSFRITLWPMWLANSKQQTANDGLVLCNTVTHTGRHTEQEKVDRSDGKPLLCQRTFSSVFRADFYTVKLHSLTYSVCGHYDLYI